ncbi:MAG: NfeD family protein [Armatimonadota bacterium]
MTILMMVIFVFIFMFMFAFSIRIVKPNHKGVITRLGKPYRTVDSGLVIVNPILDKLISIDMLEEGIVLDKIDPIKKTGIVQINKNKWTAITKKDEPISVNSRVRILDVEGMNIIVEKK